MMILVLHIRYIHMSAHVIFFGFNDNMLHQSFCQSFNQHYGDWYIWARLLHHLVAHTIKLILYSRCFRTSSKSQPAGRICLDWLCGPVYMLIELVIWQRVSSSRFRCTHFWEIQCTAAVATAALVPWKLHACCYPKVWTQIIITPHQCAYASSKLLSAQHSHLLTWAIENQKLCKCASSNTTHTLYYKEIISQPVSALW